MISYEKLFNLLKRKSVSSYAVRYDWGIGSATLERIKEGKSISTNTLNKLCEKLDCKIEDIIEYIPPKEPEPEPLTPIEEVPKEFQARFQWLMKRDNMRQADVVRATGLSRQVISAYYLGKVPPGKKTQEKFANLFAVDVNWLMGKQ